MADYTIDVGTSTIALWDGEELEASNNIIGGSIYNHNYPLNREITKGHINSPASSISRFMSYARSTYTHGVPDGYKAGDIATEEAVELIIEKERLSDINISEYFVGPPNVDYIAKAYAHITWGYVEYPETSYMMYPPIDKGEGRVTYHSAVLDINGKVIITVRRVVPEQPDFLQEIRTDIVVIPSHTYYNVKYYINQFQGGGAYFWAYDETTDVYPELSIPEGEKIVNADYLPIVPLRRDNKNLGPEYDDDGNYIEGTRPITLLYQTSKHLLDIIDVDFDGLVKEVHANPDVEDVDNAYVHFGIDINTEDLQSQIYLFQFCEQLALNAEELAPDVFNQMSIQDADYHINLRWDAISYTDVNTPMANEVSISIVGNNITLRRRTGDNSYRQVVINEFEHTNFIYGDNTIVTSLEDSQEEDNKAFNIPLRYDLYIYGRALNDRIDLLNKALIITFNSWDKRKLKWYESTIFKAIVLIISVVIAIYTGFQSLQTAYAIFSQAGIRGVIIYAAQLAITQFVLKVGFEKLAEVLGAEFAMILALAASGYGIVGGEGLGLDAKGFMNLSVGISQGVQSYTNNAMKDLVKEMAELTEQYEALNEELSDLEDALDVTSYLSVDDFLWKPELFIPEETPTEFFNRKIHAGNIGTTTLNGPEMYVENMLTLPKVNF